MTRGPTRVLVAMVVAAMIALAGVGPATASAQSDSGRVALFAGPNFSGEDIVLRDSDPDLAQIGASWAGRISSLRVLDGIAVAAYTRPNYGGTCETFTGQDSWLGDNAIGDDTIRSVKLGYTCFGPVPGRVIVTDMTVVAGARSSIACPSGYTKKLQDLNQGAGGDYVYLCVKWGPRTTEKVIRSVYVMKASFLWEFRDGCPHGGEFIETDLNSGVSGSYYMRFCVVSQTRSDPSYALKDIDFLSSSSSPYCNAPFECPSAGAPLRAACAAKLGASSVFYTGDLNTGAGGRHIHLCASVTDAAVPITQVDDRPPTIEFVDRTPSNAAGWNRSDVTVRWRCTAGGAPLASPKIVEHTVRDEGANQSTVGACTDLSGHEAAHKVTGINIDKTAPRISAGRTPEPNAEGWNNTDVDVEFTCEDSLSAVGHCTPRQVVRKESGAQFVSGTVVDRAGNTAELTVGPIKLDKTPPVIDHRVSPEPNAAGWHNSDVDVAFTCADGLSQIASCSRGQTLTNDGEGQSVRGEAIDRAGNVAKYRVNRINIDKTAPTITSTPTPRPNEHGWNNTDVTVEFSCSDATSGLAKGCPTGAELTDEGAGQTATAKVTDRAGNTATAAAELNIDKTPPRIAGGRAPSANAHGWNNTDVTAGFECKDALSGVAACPHDVVVRDEGAEQWAPGQVTDRAGNVATTKVGPINIDKTAPAIAATRTPEPNATGSNHANVTVSFACKDRLAGILTCPEPVVVGNEGAGQSAEGVAVDRAGNRASERVQDISIDRSESNAHATSRP